MAYPLRRDARPHLLLKELSRLAAEESVLEGEQPGKNSISSVLTLLARGRLG
jgi:hypothetical protein